MWPLVPQTKVQSPARAAENLGPPQHTLGRALTDTHMYTHTATHTHRCIHEHTHSHMHTHTPHTHAYTHTHNTHIHICTHPPTHAHAHTHTMHNPHIHICTPSHEYTHTCTHTHMYTHTLPRVYLSGLSWGPRRLVRRPHGFMADSVVFPCISAPRLLSNLRGDQVWTGKAWSGDFGARSPAWVWVGSEVPPGGRGVLRAMCPAAAPGGLVPRRPICPVLGGCQSVPWDRVHDRHPSDLPADWSELQPRCLRNGLQGPQTHTWGSQVQLPTSGL